MRSVSLNLNIVRLPASRSRRSCACGAMNEPSSYPHFGSRAVQPLGQEDFQFNGSGSVILAIENLRSRDPSIAVAEVASILRHWPALESSAAGQHKCSIGVTAILVTYT